MIRTASSIPLRPVEPADAELLYRVYASTRAEELAPVPWSDAQKEAFLRMQFAAQDKDYHLNYPEAEYLVILDHARPAGRLYVDRRADELSIIDIALLPAYRGKGIGTRLLQDLQAEAQATGLPVRIYVEHTNPARRLYERLGFRQLEDRGIYLLMEWRANG